MFDRMPKIEGSRDLGHAPFGAFQVDAVVCTKFKVSSSSSFDDMFDCMPKILWVT